MNKNPKRMLSAFLVLCMIISLFSTTAFAADTNDVVPATAWEEQIPIEEPAQEQPPVVGQVPAEEQALVEGEAPAEVQTPVEVKTSAEEQPPVEVETSAEEQAPVEGETPAEEQTPVEVETPAEVQTSVEVETPAEEQAPVEGETLAEVETPAEVQTPVEVQSTTELTIAPEPISFDALTMAMENTLAEISIPAEVKTFLDAVAQLPSADSVTSDNAKGIGEQVNAVIDLWDAMDEDFSTRDDVSTAMETVYAVYNAVLAAEKIEGGTVYSSSNPDVTHTLWIPVGGTFTFEFVPFHASFYYVGDATAYNDYLSDAIDYGSVTSSNTNVVTAERQFQNQVTRNTKGSWINGNLITNWGCKNLNVTVNAVNTGSATIDVIYHLANTPSTSNKLAWLLCQDTHEKIIVQVYDPAKTPEYQKEIQVGETENCLAALTYNNEPVSLNDVIFETGKTPACTTGSDIITVSKATCLTSWKGTVDRQTVVGFSVKGEKKGTATAETTYAHQRTFNAQYLSNGYQVYTLAFTELQVYIDKWNISVTQPKEVYTYTVTYTDGVPGETVFADQGYEGLKVGDSTPKFEMGDKGTETVKDKDGKDIVQPKREGYTFTGWKLTSVTPNKDGVQEKVAAADANDKCEIIYTAQWKKNEESTYYIYTLTYHENADTDTVSSMPNPKTVSPDSTTATSYDFTVSDAEPTREGYTFKGWNTQADGRGTPYTVSNVDGTITVTPSTITATVSTPNLNLYAQWEKIKVRDFVLVYHDKLGSDTDTTAVTNMPTPNLDVQFKGVPDMSKELTISSTVPTREGYTFVAWQWGGDDTERYQPDGKITLTAQTEDTTYVQADLYAVWEKNSTPDEYTVTYKWTGLPEGTTDPTVPDAQSYTPGTDVTVNDRAKDSEVVVDDITYVFSGWTVPNDIAVTDGKFSMPEKNVTITGTWTKKTTKTPQLKVTKHNDGFHVDEKTGIATVNYTVTITNKSGFDIYGLRLTDTMDEPTLEVIKSASEGENSEKLASTDPSVLPEANTNNEGEPNEQTPVIEPPTLAKVGEPDDGEPKVQLTFKDFKVQKTAGGDVSAIIPNGGNHDLVHVLQLLERNEVFADEQCITLTYTVEVENLNDKVAIKVRLDNKAVGASWSKQKPAAQKMRKFAFGSLTVGETPADPDEPDITDSASSSTGGGIQDSGGSSTEGELPRKYDVIYSWSGLPDNADVKSPDTARYFKDVEVTVDDKFTNESTTTVDGKTYVFSGWTGPSDITVAEGKFSMPGKDVTITGTWTEKTENPNPENPTTEYNVTYTWTGLPAEATETLPAAAKYQKDAEVTVDDRAKDSEVVVNGKTYVFSGWTVPDDITVTDGKFSMPEKDVIITGTWTLAVGNLTVSKTVSGNRSSTQRDFPFTVTLRDANGNLLTDNYTFTGSHTGVVNGGTATFSLRHGQSITISGLPKGTSYVVTEDPDDYSPTVSNGTGEIVANATITAAFDNYRNSSSGGGGGGGRRPTPTPGTEINEPDVPRVYYPGEEPDANEPDSPEEITIMEEDTPQSYIKTWDPENEEYVYIPEEPAPLAPVVIPAVTPISQPIVSAQLDYAPQTDDNTHSWVWIVLCMISIFGIGLLKPRKKHDDE